MTEQADPKNKPNRSKARRQALAEAQARARAVREAQLAKERRQRILIRVVAPVAVVIVVVGVFLIVKLTSHNSSSGQNTSGPSTPAPASLTQALATIPASTFDAVGAGEGVTGLQKISGPELTDGGKPELLYVGAEYCPYCAGMRWALVTSLDRFGTLSGLGVTHSSSTDVYPSTPTLSFHGATFTSQYLSVVAKELYTNIPSGNGYTTLDSLTSAESALFKSITNQSFPMLDVGGQYAGSTPYVPDFLDGMTQQQIADKLKDPTSTLTKKVLGSSNAISAAICTVTKNQPAAVCNSSGVKAAAAALLKS